MKKHLVMKMTQLNLRESKNNNFSSDVLFETAIYVAKFLNKGWLLLWGATFWKHNFDDSWLDGFSKIIESFTRSKIFN